MNKRFFIIQIIIVAMLTVSLIGTTYAWSARPAVQGGAYMKGDSTQNDTDIKYATAMKLVTPDKGYYVNGNNCTGATYAGTMVADGKVTYGTDAITAVSSQNVSANTVLYFRTEITNADAAITNTSLFIDIKYESALEGKYFVGVTTPTEDLLTYAAQSTSGGTNTVRWIPVVAQYEIAASGTAYIDWYVQFTGAGNFEITNIVLTNN